MQGVGVGKEAVVAIRERQHLSLLKGSKRDLWEQLGQARPALGRSPVWRFAALVLLVAALHTSSVKPHEGPTRWREAVQHPGVADLVIEGSRGDGG